MKGNSLLIGAVVLMMSLVGCASTDQLKKMEADIASAQETADAALAAANRAQTTASTADRKASAAMDAANVAQDSADECSERCDRMFDKVMAK